MFRHIQYIMEHRKVQLCRRKNNGPSVLDSVSLMRNYYILRLTILGKDDEPLGTAARWQRMFPMPDMDIESGQNGYFQEP